MSDLDLNQTENCMCLNLRAVTRRVTQFYDACLAPGGLTCTQFTLLAVLAKNDNFTINHLAQALLMDPTTLTRDLRRLKTQNLVKLAPGEDRRTRMVSLTPKGREKLTQTLPFWQKAQTHVVNQLGQTKFQDILQDLQLVGSAI